jgi:hypothetical protein
VEDRQTSIIDPHWCNWRGDTVDEAELSLRRSQMGRSARSFLAPGRHRAEDQGPGYWVALSGAPSPDANMALVDSSDPAVLATVLRQIQDSGFPMLFMLAGAGRRSELSAGWQHVGETPFMAFALAGTHPRPDGRVRQADIDDFDIVSELVASSFGLTQEIGDVVAGILEPGDAAGKIWLLVDDARAVSTVLTSIIDDAVCVWCMGTPARFARRGTAGLSSPTFCAGGSSRVRALGCSVPHRRASRCTTQRAGPLSRGGGCS